MVAAEAPRAQPPAEPAGPNVMVIFGAGGDLTKRKLIPAIYNLARHRLLSDAFAIVGFGGREYSDDAFRDHISRDIRSHLGAELDQQLWKWVVDRLHYVQGKLSDPSSYERLKATLESFGRGSGNGGESPVLPGDAADVFFRCRPQPRLGRTRG